MMPERRDSGSIDEASGTSRRGSPRRSFPDRARWPIGRAALAALIDMGMSDQAIAAYFAAEAAEIRALRRRYGLSG